MHSKTLAGELQDGTSFSQGKTIQSEDSQHGILGKSKQTKENTSGVQQGGTA